MARIGDMNKTELRKFIKDAFDEEFERLDSKGKFLTKDDIIKIIREVLKRQYKLWWEKTDFFIGK
jgi:hypothetical protein